MPNRPRFTQLEIVAMRDASLAGHTAWDKNARLKTLKRKIKKFGKIKTANQCCYCMSNNYGEFAMVLDIEHILPKSIFPKYMFTGKNLAISCKRCNMQIKKADVSFLAHHITGTSRRVFRSRYYSFIHPNLDFYESHLHRCVVQNGRKMMVAYKIVNGSAKGSYTYNYFNLKNLELNSFDGAQGMKGRAEIKNAVVASRFNALVSAMSS